MSLYLRLRYCVLTCCYLFNFCLPLVLFWFVLFVCSLVAVTCFSVTFSYSKYYPLLMCRLIDMYQLLLHDLTQANYDVVLTMAFVFVFAFLFFFCFFLLFFAFFCFLLLCFFLLCFYQYFVNLSYVLFHVFNILPILLRSRFLITHWISPNLQTFLPGSYSFGLWVLFLCIREKNN